MTTGNPLIAFLRRYARKTAGEEGPVLFVREVLGVEPTAQQEAMLRAYGRGERRISFRSGHGVGKTATLSWITIHALITEFPFVGIATAPTEGQLFNGYFVEVRRWFKKLPPDLQGLFEVKSESIDLIAAPESCYLACRTSRPEKPEALAGIHLEEGFVLLIADEASGIPDAIFEAASGSMSGANAMTLLAGNPVRTKGLFFDTWHGLADLWTGIQANSEESRLVTSDFVEDMKRRYGELSNAYRVRVLGEFPKADDDAVIPFELIESALKREVVPNPQAPLVWGLDVARKGSDRTALCARKGNVQQGKVKWWRDKNLMETATLVKMEYDTLPPSFRPQEILVDAIGLGAGVADRLVQLGLPAIAVNVSEASSVQQWQGNHYLNLRAELWFDKARSWFQSLTVKIEDDDLAKELGVPSFAFTKTGRIQVQSKDEIRKQFPVMGSPDLADSFILTFAGAAGTALFGSTAGTSWGAPLQRNDSWVV